MRYCFCVLGWHFYPDFYRDLYRIEGDKYIISHRDLSFLAAERGDLIDLIGRDTYILPNRGLDLGGYYQFNELFEPRKYDFVIYCHDDLVIRDPGFVQVIIKRFRDSRLKVIGNGNNGVDSEFKYGKYRDRMFWPDTDDFVIRTVRTSFCAVRPDIFDELGNFPVYWKASAKKIRKGNISLRNFAYIVTKTFGIDSITYLEKDDWLKTRYLEEMVRGARVELS